MARGQRQGHTGPLHMSLAMNTYIEGSTRLQNATVQPQLSKVLKVCTWTCKPAVQGIQSTAHLFFLAISIHTYWFSPIFEFNHK